MYLLTAKGTPTGNFIDENGAPDDTRSWSGDWKQQLHLLNHLGGPRKESWRYGEPRRPRGFEIDRKLELSRILDWQLADLGTAEDAIDVKRNAPEYFDGYRSIRNETSLPDVELGLPDRW